MRIFPVLIVLFCTTALRGQSGDSSLLILPENSYDFGRIMVDKGVVFHSFVFRNEGTIPLQITNIRTTCNCKISDWTREPVPPGKEGTITVEFDPMNKVGAFHKTIQIQSTASNPNMFLTIRGTVVPPVKKEPLLYKIGELSVKTTHLNFGFLFKGNTGIELLTVANMTSNPLKLAFDSVPEHLYFKAIPPVLQPGEYGQVEVIYNTNLIDDWDVVVDPVRLEINGRKVENALLTVTANIREDFSGYTPDQINNAPVAYFKNLKNTFDTLSEKNPVECRFMLVNTGKSDLIIRAVKPSCGCTAVKPEKSILAPGDSTYINAFFHPEERIGEVKTGIKVVTNDPQLYKQYLWIEGYIKH